MLAAFRRWRALEVGTSSAALLIVTLPLIIFPVFGFGFDTLRAMYAKRYLQGRLDLAAQIAAATTYTNTAGEIRLGAPTDGTNGRNSPSNAAVLTAYNTYEANTAAKRDQGNNAYSLASCPISRVRSGINPNTISNPNPGSTTPTCAGLAQVVGTLPTAGFDFCQDPGMWNLAARPTYGIQYVVWESVPTLFIRFIGIKNFSFKLKGEALLRQRNC